MCWFSLPGRKQHAFLFWTCRCFNEQVHVIRTRPGSYVWGHFQSNHIVSVACILQLIFLFVPLPLSFSFRQYLNSNRFSRMQFFDASYMLMFFRTHFHLCLKSPGADPHGLLGNPGIRPQRNCALEDEYEGCGASASLHIRRSPGPQGATFCGR